MKSIIAIAATAAALAASPATAQDYRSPAALAAMQFNDDLARSDLRTDVASRGSRPVDAVARALRIRNASIDQPNDRRKIPTELVRARNGNFSFGR